MVRRLIQAITAAAALIGMTVAAAAQMDVGRHNVTIATATPGGNYFLTGNAICRVLQRQGLFLDSGDVTLLNCAAMPSAGSIQNIDLLRNRVADVALVQSDWQYHAYQGTDRFSGRKLEQLRTLMSLNREAFQVLAGRGTRIARWPDLKAKKVNLGPTGTTSQVMFQELFSAHGVDEKWLTQALKLPPTAHVQEMCEGNIEALAQTSGVPNASIAEAARRCGATLVALDTPEIARMIKDRPFYTSITIPRETYAGQASDVPTFGVVATVVTTADISDALAYSLTRAIFEGLGELQNMVPVLAGLDPLDMTRAGLTAPLHPGAERYYRERGILTSQAATAAATLSSIAAGFAVDPAPAAASQPAVMPPAAVPAKPALAKPAAKASRARARPAATR